MAEERVQKILARAGYGSRRASEELISSGRVRINGQVAVLGSKADPQRDTITVDNQPIGKPQTPIYIALNKPQGVLSEVSLDEPRQTVRDLVPVPGHMFIVGRLDLESEGLILLTNDGELANRLTHPRYGHEKEYRVLVGARPDEEQLEAWRHGIVLEDGHRTAPAQVRVESLAGKGAWLRVILHEGRKRQIREMGRLTGLPVLRILRLRIGSLLLGDLRPGEWRELTQAEVNALRSNKALRAPVRVSRRVPRRAGQEPARKTTRNEGQRDSLHRRTPGDDVSRGTKGRRSEQERADALTGEDSPRATGTQRRSPAAGRHETARPDRRPRRPDSAEKRETPRGAPRRVNRNRP